MAPRNPEQEKEILEWIEAVMEEPLPEGDFAEVLQNGVVLCKLINKLAPGSVKKFKEKGPAFLLMENVQSFLAAAKKYGVPDEEVFQTPDLFEARNLSQVALCLFSLGRATQKHPEFTGPQIGPKMATKNERNFSDEQIRQGRDATIGLQSGTNVGASQAGHGGMGNTRHM
eukprot:TRINITY_DN2161_c0_g1_i2.p1 TRINITY_DN2161_c0_g1~~TRINITY_DN2161_c0_g1_i2.p1  ORF type:complete len:171 (-),score=56.02 TRINITY_DN2161_c0_g1_i2:122-634(-)